MTSIPVTPSSSALTDAYASGWESLKISCRQHREVVLFCDFAPGNATKIYFKFSTSPDDGDTWYPVLDPETGQPVEDFYTVSEIGTKFSPPGIQVPGHSHVKVLVKVDVATGSPTLSMGFLGDGAVA